MLVQAQRTQETPASTTGAATAPAESASTETPLILLSASTHFGRPDENYVFVLDGDSVILASSVQEPPSTPDPVLVMKVRNSRGAIGTPIVLASRNLISNEFWDFVATDNSDRDPTSGFYRVTTGDQLWDILHNILPNQPNFGWGTAH